jgi:tRNA(Ile)-lysidine synthase
MLFEKVKKTIKKYVLINKGDRILIGVSGGPDSLTLLFVLNGLKKEFNLKLHIAHLDHMLRKNSAKDREFVERLAAKLKLPITGAKINLKAVAKSGSLEEICRNARLGFLFNVAKKIKADKIALGHNLDDQAETVLMRILRGTGLYGLAAISPKRNIAGFQVIRPLIEVKREDIEKYLKRKGIKPRIDTSNVEDIFFRNKLRNNLLPVLEKGYNRNIKEVLSNLAKLSADDYDYLLKEAGRIAQRMGKKINLARFLKLHPAMQRLVLRLKIQGLTGDTRRLEFRHIEEIEDLLRNRPANSIVDLPKGLAVVKRKTTFFCYRRKL